MHELDKRIATLRLRLAEISARKEQLKGLQRQYKGQLDKVMDFAIYEHGDMNSALSMADEVESRIIQNERDLHHLEAIQSRGQEELEALMLTRSVERAKSEMAALEVRRRELAGEIARQGHGNTAIAQLQLQLQQIDGEIKRLGRAISDASDEAARALAARARRRQPDTATREIAS